MENKKKQFQKQSKLFGTTSKDEEFKNIELEKKKLEKIRRANSNFFKDIPGLKENLVSPLDDVNVVRKILNNQIDSEIEMSFLSPGDFIEKIRYVERSSNISDGKFFDEINSFRVKELKNIESIVKDISIMQDKLIEFSSKISMTKIEKKVFKKGEEGEEAKSRNQGKEFSKRKLILAKKSESLKFKEEQELAKIKIKSEIKRRLEDKKNNKIEAKKKVKNLKEEIKTEFKEEKKKYREEYRREKLESRGEFSKIRKQEEKNKKILDKKISVQDKKISGKNKKTKRQNNNEKVKGK